MAIVRNNLLLHGVSGSIGNLTISQRGGKTVLSVRRGPSSKPPSEAQLRVLANFSKCSAYAKIACTDPAMKAAYQEIAEPGRSAYCAAMKDAFNPPAILDVSWHEDAIVVEAVDDFKVKSVTVSVYDHTDELIEQGEAVITQNEMYWKYELKNKQSRIAGARFNIAAFDYPGNESEVEIILIPGTR